MITLKKDESLRKTHLTQTGEILQCMLNVPSVKRLFSYCSWQDTLPIQEGRSPCRIPEKSLIILGISFGERSGYISVFQSSQQSKTHCCTLQVPELWKSRQSPMKLNQIMSTVLRAAHTPEAHRCLPARNSD